MRPTRTTTALILFSLAAFLATEGRLAAAADRATPSCTSTPGLEALLEPGAVLVFGELHGTVEAPAFVGNAVCQALESGHEVTVGLEIPAQDELLAAYLASEGSANDRAAFFASPFWQTNDGRSSEAMAKLITQLHAYQRAGSKVRLLLFDRRGSTSQGRDRAMADHLAEAIRAKPSDLFIVLTGNIHSRIAPGTRWNPDFEPMMYLASAKLEGRKVTSLDLSHAGGTAWVCLAGGGCGAHSMRGRGEGEGQRIELFEADGENHHGTYFVGTISASPPANGGS